MTELTYGRDLNSQRAHRINSKFDGDKQHVRLTLNSSTMNTGQTLQVRLPTLADDDVIVPIMAKVVFKLAVAHGQSVDNIAQL